MDVIIDDPSSTGAYSRGPGGAVRRHASGQRTKIAIAR
jgi:hypothetical protein